MADTIQVKQAEQSCAAGLRYAQKHASDPPKDAVLCCEGSCLKGETARRAANLIAHRLLPDKAVRICHGGLLEKTGGMKDLVERANRVLILEGCGMACATRLAKGAIPGLEPQTVLTSRFIEYDGDVFGVNEVPDEQINSNARKVAEQVVEEYFR